MERKKKVLQRLRLSGFAGGFQRGVEVAYTAVTDINRGLWPCGTRRVRFVVSCTCRPSGGFREVVVKSARITLQ